MFGRARRIPLAIRAEQTPVWEHYKKTFTGMQVLIWAVAAIVYLFFGHSLQRAGAFLVVMQFSAVIGAVWAARIAAIARRRETALPLRPRG
jgi:hypothetical protein